MKLISVDIQQCIPWQLTGHYITCSTFFSGCSCGKQTRPIRTWHKFLCVYIFILYVYIYIYTHTHIYMLFLFYLQGHHYPVGSTIINNPTCTVQRLLRFNQIHSKDRQLSHASQRTFLLIFSP